MASMGLKEVCGGGDSGTTCEDHFPKPSTLNPAQHGLRSASNDRGPLKKQTPAPTRMGLDPAAKPHTAEVRVNIRTAFIP